MTNKITTDDLITTVNDVNRFANSNVDLADALQAGSEFRVAFKKPGASKWTRVAIKDKERVRAAGLAEVARRQRNLRSYLRNLVTRYLNSALDSGT